MRLPRKALVEISGLPLIVHVAARSRMASSLDKVYVCTDSGLIADVCIKYGIDVILTKSRHLNGTERISEAAEILELDDTDIVIDIQGDEPLMKPTMINNMADYMIRTHHGVAVPYINMSDVNSPSRVKVIEADGRVIYFTRADAPYGVDGNVVLKKHLSVIGFRVCALRHFVSLAPGKLERIEGIELLRLIESGVFVGTYEEFGETLSVDTPEDLDRVKILMCSDDLRGAY